jgi:recombination protein RecT
MSKTISRKEEFKNQFSKYIPAISKILPTHMSLDRFQRVATLSILNDPNLLNCDIRSLCGAIAESAILGLEVGNGLNHAYLIPYGKTVQFMPSYKGYIEVSSRSGKTKFIKAHCVYKDDVFEYSLGFEESLIHKPSITVDRCEDNIVGVYSLAELTDGTRYIEYMSKSQIDKIKSASKTISKPASPWNKYYGQMARKSVIRRMFNYIPITPEIADIIDADEKAREGKQDNAAIIEGEVETPEPEKSAAQSLVEKMEEQTVEKTESSADDYEKAKSGVI